MEAVAKMIWICGKNGMLGRELCEMLDRAATNHDATHHAISPLSYFATGREVDITSYDALSAYIKNCGKKIQCIVNCAAYTAVDNAEDDKQTCYLINAEGAGNLARIAKELGATLIHISTDYVFDGAAQKPYTETDPPNPTGVYGATKYEGELLISQNNDRNYILRTAWLYGRHGKTLSPPCSS